MSGEVILGRPKSEILCALGTALLQVKNARRLTYEDMRVVFGLKADDMIAKYIGGEAAMDVFAWLRAIEAWPELAERFEEQLMLARRAA